MMLKRVWLTLILLSALAAATAAAPAVLPERLEAHVRMLSEQCVPRDAEHPDNLDKAAAYIRQEFINSGGRVRDQVYTAGGKMYRNVVAQFGPTEGERIVVGAHYDAVSTSPGADDNASGVAGLIELARLLAIERPRVCVELVAFTLEEKPYFRTEQMGSFVHAAELAKSGVRVRLMIALDMIGYFTGPRRDAGPVRSLLLLLDPARGDYVVIAGRMQDAALVARLRVAISSGGDLPTVSVCAAAGVPYLDRSDHINYWKLGYPAVVVSDTAELRNPHYHSPTDTAGTLDYARMAKVVAGVRAAIDEVDE